MKPTIQICRTFITECAVSCKQGNKYITSFKDSSCYCLENIPYENLYSGEECINFYIPGKRNKHCTSYAPTLGQNTCKCSKLNLRMRNWMEKVWWQLLQESRLWSEDRICTGMSLIHSRCEQTALAQCCVYRILVLMRVVVFSFLSQRKKWCGQKIFWQMEKAYT